MKSVFKTFRFRLFLSYLALSAAVLASAFFLINTRVEGVVLSSLKAKLAEEAALISSRLNPAELASPRLNGLARELGGRVGSRVTFIAADGRVLADSELDAAGVAAMENHADRAEVEGALAGNISYDLRSSATLGKVMLYAAYPVSVSGGRVAAVARLAVPAVEIETAHSMLTEALFAALGIAFLLSLLLSVPVSAGFSRPFNKIVYASKKFAGGEFSYRIQKDFHGEMGKLAETLNSMAASIEENIGRLELQSQQLSAAFTGTAEGVLMTGADSRITTLNPAMEKMFSLSPAALSRPLLEVIPSARLSGICSRVVAEGAQLSGEMELTLPVQGLFSVNASPIFAGGQTSGCLLLVRDITAPRRLDAMRRDFVANVSHELKTPLTAIRGYVETLMGGALDSRADALEFLGVIHAHTLRLDNIVSDLLKLSSLEAPSAGLKKEPVPLKALADSLIAGLASVFSARKAEVVNAIPAGLAAQADPEKLGQVFINLLDNAVKFSVDSPKVEISAEEVPGALKITVRDNGIGIPAEHLQRVFERFYRVDKGRSRDLGGTGLGLSIVKHIVELHGGAAGLDSAPGRGSAFWFTLPL